MFTPIQHKHFFWCSCIAAIALSAFLHLWKLGEIPNGFFCDEISIGYNAYSILISGADEYGTGYPFFFRGLDNYHDPVMVYSIVPLIKTFGLQKWAVRLPSSLFMLAASAAFAFLVYSHMPNKWLALGGGFMFSILPWAFPVSRVALSGYTPMLLGIILGWFFWLKAIKNKSAKFAIFSAFFLVFAMYSHNCGRPVVAVLVLCFLAAFNKNLFKRKMPVAILIISLAVFLLPLLFAFLKNPACLTSRFSEISLYKNSPTTGDFIFGIIFRYFEYFSPSFLFLFGDSDLRHNTGAGELYIWMLPLIILGTYKILKCRRNPYYFFIGLGILTYPVAAILTKDHMHSTRCINGAPFWCILAIIGTEYIYKIRKKIRGFRIILYIFIAFTCAESVTYFINYFGKYAEASRIAFNAPLIEAIEFLFKNKNDNDILYISSSTFHHPVTKDFKPVWYSHFLFFGKIDPKTYQKNGIPPEIISHYDPASPPDSGFLLRMNTRIGHDEKFTPCVEWNNEKIPEGANLLLKIPLLKDSNRFFEIYKISGTL
jgi:hypothetical protein